MGHVGQLPQQGEVRDLQDEAEEAYREAIAAVDTEAWRQLGNLLYAGPPGRGRAGLRQAVAAGNAAAQSNLDILRSQQQGRQGGAAPAHREPEAEQGHRQAPAREIQQWPLTAAATQVLLALPARKIADPNPWTSPSRS